MTPKLMDAPRPEATTAPAPATTARRSPRARALVPLLGVGLIALLYVVSKNYEVVEEGQLLSYPAQVAEIRFFDQFTLYVAQERTRPLDAVDAVLLSMLAGTALFSLALLRRAHAGAGRLQAFLAVCVAGFVFLAADESLALHETIGHNLQFLTAVPGVHRPDDLIFAAYLVPALAVLVVFRDVIRSSREAMPLFGAAVALFLGAAVMDVAGIGIDELLEPLSAGLLLAGFVLLALQALRDAGVVRGSDAMRS